jgi:hypothetical protein
MVRAMNSQPLHRGIAATVLILLCYAVVEFGYLGPLLSELSRGAENAQLLSDIEDRLTALEVQYASLPAEEQSQANVGFSEGTADQNLIVLQETVQTFLVSSGGQAMAIQGSQVPEVSGLTRLTVFARAAFQEQSLLNFLRQVESSPTGISIQSLEVLPPPSGQGGSPMLDVTILLGAVHSNAF